LGRSKSPLYSTGAAVTFGNYLKTYRADHGLTQEDLVHGLYSFDDKVFHGLDTTTISKWERGITQPKVAKQVRVLQYFQKETGEAFPSLMQENIAKTEELICKTGMENLILGKSKELILNFPSKMMNEENLKITLLRHSDRMVSIIEIATDIRNSNNPPFMHYTTEQMKAWALNPNNLFLVCNYKDIITGLFFSLRLRPEVFDAIIHFKKAIATIEEQDFASFDEPGCNYVIAFFALNGKSASMLFLRYYAHLIANQHVIQCIGATTVLNDAKKIINNMNLEHVADYEEENIIVSAFQADLPSALASDNVIRMILRRQGCPEE
jgi:transcriptional regulator with XRE-family HTH domain